MQHQLAKMRFALVILTLLFLTSCSNNQTKPYQTQMKIALEIIPEDTEGGYTLVWKDSVGQAIKHLCPDTSYFRFLRWRPFETHFTVTNRNNDTLGYYYGVSAPHDYLFFAVTDPSDSIIMLHPSIGGYFCSDYIFSQLDTPFTLIEQEAFYQKQIEGHGKVFKPIEIDIRKILRKKTEMIFDSQ